MADVIQHLATGPTLHFTAGISTRASLAATKAFSAASILPNPRYAFLIARWLLFVLGHFTNSSAARSNELTSRRMAKLGPVDDHDRGSLKPFERHAGDLIL
jgi:hypothetical protein